MNAEDEELYRTAWRVFGAEAQLGVAIEECCELAVALSHLRRGRIPALGEDFSVRPSDGTRRPDMMTAWHVATEIADVLIVIEQLQALYPQLKRLADDEREQKLARLRRKVEQRMERGT